MSGETERAGVARARTLALSSKLHEHQGGDLFLVLLMAAIGVALNPAAAFAFGLPIAYALQHEWIRT